MAVARTVILVITVAVQIYFVPVLVDIRDLVVAIVIAFVLVHVKPVQRLADNTHVAVEITGITIRLEVHPVEALFQAIPVTGYIESHVPFQVVPT